MQTFPLRTRQPLLGHLNSVVFLSQRRRRTKTIPQRYMYALASSAWMKGQCISLLYLLKTPIVSYVARDLERPFNYHPRAPQENTFSVYSFDHSHSSYILQKIANQNRSREELTPQYLTRRIQWLLLVEGSLYCFSHVKLCKLCRRW